MSVNIRLYKMNDVANTINKRKTLLSNISINLTSGVDVINPIIILNLENISEIIDDVNYVEIPILKRFYFVENKYIRSNKFITLELHVDVLESYKNQILSGRTRVTNEEVSVNIDVVESNVSFNEGEHSFIIATLGGE